MRQPLARTSAAPGKTRLANFYRVKRGAAAALFLVDLPGYGYARGGDDSAREFNRLAGWTPAEDTLPERFLDAPLPNDPAAHLSRERLEALVAEYHRQRG